MEQCSQVCGPALFAHQCWLIHGWWQQDAKKCSYVCENVGLKNPNVQRMFLVRRLHVNNKQTYWCSFWLCFGLHQLLMDISVSLPVSRPTVNCLLNFLVTNSMAESGNGTNEMAADWHNKVVIVKPKQKSWKMLNHTTKLERTVRVCANPVDSSLLFYPSSHWWGQVEAKCHQCVLIMTTVYNTFTLCFHNRGLDTSKQVKISVGFGLFPSQGAIPGWFTFGRTWNKAIFSVRCKGR